MIREQRIDYIMEELKKKGVVSISELTHVLGASRSTIHRDLGDLEEQHLLHCVRGGAVAAAQKASLEPTVDARKNRFLEEKQRIARAALDFIQDNETIILDSGTTVNQLAKLLAGSKNLYLATNDLHSAMDLSGNPDISVIVLGGILRTGHFALNGLFTEDILRQIHADTAFLSVDALDFNVGPMVFSMEEIPTKRLMIQSSQKSIILCDHSKFESIAFVNICAFSKIDLIITGKETAPEHLRRMEELNIKYLTV